MTNFVATLPMYDWPETQAQTDALWSEFVSNFKVTDLNLAALLRPAEAELDAVWRDPNLILGQTCWGPLYGGLSADVLVLGQPLYNDVPGGDGIFYRSAIVGRGKRLDPPAAGHIAVDPVSFKGKRFAYNAEASMSGYLALEDDLANAYGLDLNLFDERIETGSHRASIRAVAHGKADFAAIDCKSWAMACKFEPAAAELAPMGWTAQRLGLPYICSPSLDESLIAETRRVLSELGAVVAKSA